MTIPRTFAAMAILLAVTLPARTEAQSPAPSAGQQRDPFLKDQTPGAASQASASGTGGAHPGPPLGLVFTVEVYAMALDDASQVLEQSPNGEARHAAALTLMKNGKARLETLLCCAIDSGKRADVEPSDEERYTTEYTDTRVMGGSFFSTAFETRECGDKLEFEAVESPDKKSCNLNLVLQRVRLLGFNQYYANAQKPPVVAQPRFQTSKISTSRPMPIGQTEFLGTLNDPPQFTGSAGNATSEEVRVVFGKIDAMDLSVPGGPAKATGIWNGASLELSFYSLDREAARQILSQGFKDESCYNAVKALAARQEAKLERMTALKTNTGEYAVTEEANEVRYPTEFALSRTGSNAVAPPDADIAEPTSFETRNAGLSVEFEVFTDAADQIADINLVPSIVSYEGDSPRPGSDAKLEPQPLFESRKLTSEVPSVIGKHTLIGTFNHPGDDGVNGRKDDGRVWFGFIRAVL